MVNFFVPHCAQLMQPLHELLAPSKVKSQTVTWDEVAEQAFNNVKRTHHAKVNAPTCLVTDASDSAVGAVLQQYDQARYRLSLRTFRKPPSRLHSASSNSYGCLSGYEMQHKLFSDSWTQSFEDCISHTTTWMMYSYLVVSSLQVQF